MLKEFKEFALKGNMFDMAVGIVIGAAFATVVGSLVADIFMPVIGQGAVTVNYGRFINEIITFIGVALAVFFVVKGYNRAKRQEEEAPSAPPAPSAEETLLTEIRDLLAKSA